jgi:diadenosine tetraphosphate (Ap4A) HIT family hydrolase
VLRESQELLAFVDQTPRAPLHALIIPKRLVRNVLELSPDSLSDIQLLENMQSMAHDILREYALEAWKSGDYRLVFHIPPFNSVNHLHVHVLAPFSEITQPFYRFVKYLESTRWSMSLSRLLTRLRNGKKALPQ